MPAGSIPAYAGQPPCPAARRRPSGVHPRIRGAARLPVVDVRRHQGPSPHTRGSLADWLNAATTFGSIPAYAGQPINESLNSGDGRVHPRIRGAAITYASVPSGTQGPSPHTRGSLPRGSRFGECPGSIPAYAGQPLALPVEERPRRVHPRIRGAARQREGQGCQEPGPSPHTRGSPSKNRRYTRASGSIPAYAGQPAARRRRSARRRVHPRIRGAAILLQRHHFGAQGPSPHTRGSQPVQVRVDPQAGSIPAYAGQPFRTSPAARGTRVHPRIRGAAWTNIDGPKFFQGPSPHTRGSPSRSSSRASSLGSIPAYAGQPLRRRARVQGCRVHPRIRGAAYASNSLSRANTGPSPHTRGSRGKHRGRQLYRGSIPAYAGQPRSSSRARTSARVHPRIRGAASVIAAPACFAPGPSPHTRGSPLQCGPVAPARGSIPAYAGQPPSPPSNLATGRVHPRIRGAARLPSARRKLAGGPSPHTRGSRRRARR